jgi:hypothetical protein
MINEIREKFEITDEEALYIKAGQEKAADLQIRVTVSHAWTRSGVSRRTLSRTGQRANPAGLR